MPFAFTCIACGGEMEVNKQHGKIQCKECGRFLDGTMPPADTPATETEATETAPESQRWVLGGLIYKGELHPWLRTLVESLRAELHNGQREAALSTCRRLLEMERDFLDAHLWIARLSQDDEERRAHLEKLLALQPGNLEATRLLLVLNGEISEEEARRSEDLYFENLQTTDEVVGTDTEVLLCPICRGTLTIGEAGDVKCAFCGYKDEDTANAVHATPDTSLAVALIKQRGKAVRWQVGERMVHCNECGAERVLPENKMSSRCPFCNSKHVIVQDTLGAFRQPDGIVKFAVRRKDAENILQEHLNNRMEKLKGLFIENRAARIRYDGVFLPFWAFDIFGKAIIQDVYRDAKEFHVERERHEIAHQLHNALVPGVDSPPRKMLNRLSDYDLSKAIPYTPKLLSKFAAELYSRDFAQSSLDVRERFRQSAIDRNHNRNPNVTRTVMTQVDNMTMRLLLLPVWVMTIVEKDHDVRTALINGQTGKAVLGQARKPTP